MKQLYCFVVKAIYILYRSIEIPTSTYFRGFPILESKDGGKIIIGDHCTLNSLSIRYHVNLHSRTRLFSDGESARIEIGKNTRIHGSCLHAQSIIKIGSNCLIAGNCNIIDSNGHELLLENAELRYKSVDKPSPIVIENNVWIGTNSTILKGVKIGEGSVIAAGSVVNRDIPPRSLAGGVPAKILRGT